MPVIIRSDQPRAHTATLFTLLGAVCYHFATPPAAEHIVIPAFLPPVDDFDRAFQARNKYY